MILLFTHGGFLMYPLLLCSVIALTLIIERTIFWVTSGIDRDRPLMDRVLELSAEENWEEIRKATQGSKNSVVRVLISGILHRDYSPVKAMESAAADEIYKMRRFMGALDTIITIAPLLGILGTVVGIIESFDMLGASGIEDPMAVTGGIAKALITTASGLTIAIVTVFPYNFFNARIERAAQIIEKYATSFEIMHERQMTQFDPCREDTHEN
ncbi:MotA/TolQ/ExbB proton channel family protein [Desulfotignum phosphitoxidans]|uniref:MotA/TolQ/ExbB proton channel n=1 Tax=Desulfotignum phosphitoxidans DSM 13687 TaxID=1286635 RepID=S0FZR2_9BACT|nr:MotA/TolQ/ExbB proton channel family protein [Desulfotignum phosphitoxidans]EMS77467.1 MotA/TolQ/ExbB proton channel [Desulfotignum phosphitoxidans DSM 13687]